MLEAKDTIALVMELVLSETVFQKKLENILKSIRD